MYRFFKRVLDFIMAVALILVCMPLYVIISIAVLFSGAQGVFFSQKRVGLDEKIFRVYKFKSMNDKRDSNNNLLPNEDRLTKVGRFIRKTSLDEIPQFINVLVGDMSFVGPRPLHVRYLEHYTPQERTRHLVRPGITGLAQVSGRNSLQWDDRLQLDIDYTKSISLKTDMKIILETVNKIFRASDIKSEGIIGLDELRESKK